MAIPLDYQVTVCDPREEYQEQWSDLPQVTMSKEMPDDLVIAMNLDGNSAVVALTHDPKLDVYKRQPLSTVGCRFTAPYAVYAPDPRFARMTAERGFASLRANGTLGTGACACVAQMRVGLVIQLYASSDRQAALSAIFNVLSTIR